MSAKLTEQLKRLTEKNEPCYNDFGDSIIRIIINILISVNSLNITT